MSASRALYEKTMAAADFYPQAQPHPQWDDRHWVNELLDVLLELRERGLCTAELAELERVQDKIAPPRLQIWRDAASKAISAAAARTDQELGPLAQAVRKITGQPEQARGAQPPAAEGVRTTVLEPTEEQKRRIAEARERLTPREPSPAPGPEPLSAAELDASSGKAAAELELEQERAKSAALEAELAALRATPPPAAEPTDSETTPLRNFTPPSR